MNRGADLEVSAYHDLRVRTFCVCAHACASLHKPRTWYAIERNRQICRFRQDGAGREAREGAGGCGEGVRALSTCLTLPLSSSYWAASDSAMTAAFVTPYGATRHCVQQARG